MISLFGNFAHNLPSGHIKDRELAEDYSLAKGHKNL